MELKDGDNISVKINRDGKDETISGKIVMPKEQQEGYQAPDDSKKAVREAWLKG